MLKRNVFSTAVIVLSLFFLLPNNAFSFGIGIYSPVFGTGSGDGTLSFDDFDDETDFDFESDHGGIIGIVLDTRVARRGTFNYRLHLGVERGDNDYMVDDGAFNRYVLDNTFGFGVVQTRVVRVWLGPQLRLAAISHTDDENDYTFEVSGVEFGLAPVLGVNVNIGRVMTIAAELGYRFSGLAGSWEYSYSDFEYDYSNTGTFSMSERTFFINLAVIFRVGDVFDSGYEDVDDEKPDYDQDYY